MRTRIYVAPAFKGLMESYLGIYIFIYLNIFIQGVYILAQMLFLKYVPCYTFTKLNSH